MNLNLSEPDQENISFSSFYVLYPCLHMSDVFPITRACLSLNLCLDRVFSDSSSQSHSTSFFSLHFQAIPTIPICLHADTQPPACFLSKVHLERKDARYTGDMGNMEIHIHQENMKTHFLLKLTLVRGGGEVGVQSKTFLMLLLLLSKF